MIQFNLLPDVKKQYVKARRVKRLMITISFIVSAASIAVVVIMFSVVQIAQKKNISDLTKDIKERTAEVKGTQDLDTMLTVQNQINLLEELHQEKPESSRVFDIVKYSSPPSVKLTSLDLDFDELTIKMSGTADSLATVNLFVDNLKATNFAVASDTETRNPAYSEIDTALNGNDQGATFTISMVFDALLYNNTEDLLLSIGAQELSAITNTEGQP